MKSNIDLALHYIATLRELEPFVLDSYKNCNIASRI